MKLEFLDDISDGGRFANVVAEQLVRLYDFDKSQAKQFREVVRQTIIENHKPLDLATVNFIEVVNCNLTLRISDADVGITTVNKKNFFCDLTIKKYVNLIHLLEPFCSEDSS